MDIKIQVQIKIEHDDLIPVQIQLAVNEIKNDGDQLSRVETDDGIEWWLLDREGELIEAFWLED